MFAFLLLAMLAGDATPQRTCASLRELTTYEFSIATATELPAVEGGPALCRVIGQILPHVQFEVDLPSTWNGRFLMTGNGGYAGTLGSPTRQARRDFATAATDTGHDEATEPGASFATDSQKLIDYAFRSLHVTALTAKRIIAAYYGRQPVRSYFQGCSTGGRQALILAQRFPDDFDGIISGAPILDFTGMIERFSCTADALAAAPVPAAKLPLLAERVYAVCDAVDGLRDGIIDDPRDCRFTPSRDLPICTGADTAACFTRPQIQALEKIYGDVTINGQRRFPGWPVGAEAVVDGRSGWQPWIVRDGAPTFGAAFAETYHRYMAAPNAPAARHEYLHQLLDATNPDLTAFRNRGGKLLMYYGWADPALNAQRGVDYYEEVLRRMGPSTRNFFRLFLVPGMFHCGRGPGPDSIDPFAAIYAWVESNQAPDQLLAARKVDGKTVRTRPLCPYPERAKYKGSGSIDDAASFTCQAPRP